MDVPFKTATGRHGTFSYLPNDIFVGRSLELYGEYSESEVAVFGRLLKPGAVVIEAGANIGALTVPIARQVGAGGRVVAYEPQAPIADLLARNLAANGLANVEVRRAALGGQRGILHVPKLDYRARGNFGGVALGDGDGEDVPVDTIDGLGLARVDLIKIDVEGMEAEVLDGAAETIRRCRPILYVENDRVEKSKRLIATIFALGYRAWWHVAPLYNEDNHAKQPTNIFGDVVSVNLLCLPAESKIAVVGSVPVISEDDTRHSAGRRASHAIAMGNTALRSEPMPPSDTRQMRIPFMPLGIEETQQARFLEKTQSYLGQFGETNTPDAAVFAADSMIVFMHTAGFLSDQRFLSAIFASAPDDRDLTIIWRTHILCWAARHGLSLDGDFVECGTYRGYSASVIVNYLEFGQTGRQFFLYDLFDPTGGAGEGHRMPDHGPTLYREVTARFAAFPKVRVIKGRVPDSFAQACPDKIAFLHIDMNSAEAEIAALEHLFDRVVPGGIIVLDDYGYRCYRAQHDAENEFAKARGYPIVELPTGQGLLIKR